jgi:hypothetical protein
MPHKKKKQEIRKKLTKKHPGMTLPCTNGSSGCKRDRKREENRGLKSPLFVREIRGPFSCPLLKLRITGDKFIVLDVSRKTC